MRKHATLVYAFLDRNFIMLRRYPLNFVGSLLTYLLVFLMIFLGGKTVAPTAFGNSLDAIIVGYFLLSTVLSTFFTLSGMINNEAQYGTLEQLYISPFRFPTIMFAAVVSNVIISVTMGVANLLVVLLITQRALTLDVVTIVPILSLTILHAIGLSFLFGGIALLYKRIRSLFSIVQFFFIGLISLALTDMFWPRLLPVGQGAAMLHEAMANGTTLFEFQMIDHVILIGTAVVYLSLGYLSFHIAQNQARRKGLLDEY